jgi:hypothetical protein
MHTYYYTKPSYFLFYMIVPMENVLRVCPDGVEERNIAKQNSTATRVAVLLR